VPVLAWGLGLERIITDYYHIVDLRDCYKNDLEQLRTIKKWMRQG
jgi:phenylalanyl-tRNA synthetase alpha subunit